MSIPIRLALAAAAWLLLSLGLAAVGRAGDACLVYTYMDARGEMHKTDRLDAVPAAFRESMVSYRDCAKAAALRKRGPETIPPPADPPGTEKMQTNRAPAEKPWSAEPAAEPGPAAHRPGVWRKAMAWIGARPTWQMILLILFWAASLAGELGIVITAFRVGVLWGLACLFLPFVGLVFVIVYWRDVWPSFVTALVGGAGAAIMLLGFAGP